ncbi:MAG: hypothetical protein AAFZ18_38110 [Myxococcota bacterium]
MRIRSDLPTRRPTVFLRSRSLKIDDELQVFAETRAEAMLSAHSVGILDFAIEQESRGGYRCRARISAASSAETIGVVGADTPRAALVACMARVRSRLQETHQRRLRRRRRGHVAASAILVAVTGSGCAFVGSSPAQLPPEPHRELVLPVHLAGGEPGTREIGASRPLTVARWQSSDELERLETLGVEGDEVERVEFERPPAATN